MFFEPLLAALAVCNVLQRHNPLAKARNCKAVLTVLEKKAPASAGVPYLSCSKCPPHYWQGGQGVADDVRDAGAVVLCVLVDWRVLFVQQRCVLTASVGEHSFTKVQHSTARRGDRSSSSSLWRCDSGA